MSQIFNLAEELEKERKKNKELEIKLKEANESITWWNNRFNAIERDNRELKELCDKYEEEHKTTFEKWKKDIKIIDELEKFLNDYVKIFKDNDNFRDRLLFVYAILDKLNELKGDNK